MKLKTSIKPRTDGTVIVEGLDGTKTVFEVDADGDLGADVTHDATVAQLLNTGNFWPADPEDHATALALTGQQGGEDGDKDPNADDEGDGSDDSDGQELVNGGMPLESNTPPKAKPKTPPKAK